MKRWWWVAAAVGAVVIVIGVFAYFIWFRPTEKPPEVASALPGGVVTPAAARMDGPRFTGANVVIVTIDTLRRDHLAPYGAPFATIAASRLAKEGVVFEHAVSQVPLTLPSHTSIFTGLYPPHHTVRDNGGFVVGKDVTTLAKRFLAAGYKTAGFVSSYVLHSRWGIGQGYETYDDSFDYAGLESRPLIDVERPAGPVVDAALAWLRQPGRTQHPFYLSGTPLRSARAVHAARRVPPEGSIGIRGRGDVRGRTSRAPAGCIGYAWPAPQHDDPLSLRPR